MFLNRVCLITSLMKITEKHDWCSRKTLQLCALHHLVEMTVSIENQLQPFYFLNLVNQQFLTYQFVQKSGVLGWVAVFNRSEQHVNASAQQNYCFTAFLPSSGSDQKLSHPTSRTSIQTNDLHCAWLLNTDTGAASFYVQTWRTIVFWSRPKDLMST